MIIDEAFPGKTFKSSTAEFQDGGHLVLVIAFTEKKEMTDRSGQTVPKPVIHFEGEERVLICNKTNFRTIEAITKQRDSDNWPGHKIELYNDEMVQYGDSMGGVRVRKPTEAKKASAAEDGDDIPF